MEARAELQLKPHFKIIIREARAELQLSSSLIWN